MEVTPQDAQFVRELVFRRAAIKLDDEKDYFIEMRLAQLASTCGASSIAELVDGARRGLSGAEIRIIEALTTHETYFFRDLHPFEIMKKQVIPELMAARQSARQLTIWCAACSSGQEPYSLALMLRENFTALATWKIRIVATDLSEQILAKARDGIFTQIEMNRGLPAAYLPKYFERSGLHWQIRTDIRAMVEFRQLNLIDNWFLTPTPDLVMLRNVLIYFDLPTKRRILDRVRQQIASDGRLFLGAAETTLNVAEGWERMANDKQTYYRVKVQ
ncbi:MAG TPA: protein-glutamate O-methyltransferase CheR [Steroidobacteraceae bacterium]